MKYVGRIESDLKFSGPTQEQTLVRRALRVLGFVWKWRPPDKTKCKYTDLTVADTRQGYSYSSGYVKILTSPRRKGSALRNIAQYHGIGEFLWTR